MTEPSGPTAERDWKDTILLPQTEFSMRADLAAREGATIERWQREDLYGQMLAARAEAPLYVLHDGPPYANGDIHHGHALNKILKDFVVKYRMMTGYRVPFVPGWDCHGLPIEQKVDAELGEERASLSVVEFRERCRAWARRWIEVQRESFRRLQVIADWDHPYATIDADYERSITQVLHDVVQAGYVYRGVKPVHWSWAARTALAEAEVEYAPHEAPSVYVKFRMIDPPAWLSAAAGGRPVDMVIWTTTPWTLPSNVAIVLHPELAYQLVDVGADAPIVVAEALRDEVVARCGLSDVRVLHTFEGAQLVGRIEDAAPPRPIAQHPFLERVSVLLPADYVTTEQGTGCVHTAPGHGADDFRTGQRYGLPVIAPVDERGCYTAEVPDYEGQHVFRANAAIEERLHASGRLLNPPGAIYRVDRYPHCWRTKKPLIFRATAQWFLRVDHADLRERALDAIGRTRWIPTWGENRIRGMIEQRPDWCLSRQRAWGVPIPSYRCGTCGEHTLDADLIARVADAMQTGGSNVWLEQPVEAFLPEGAVCPHCGGPSSRFEKGQDTLDVWFDSGVSWAAVVRDRLGGEGMIDLYLEGSDQHRGWFHTSLLTSVAAQGDAPYRAVLTHGFIVDEKGHKYAKSSPNFEPLSRMLDQHGSEVFRLWVAMTDYRTDVTLSNDSLKQAAGAYRKVRNTLRFLLGNLGDFDPTTVDPSTLPFDALDAWMLRRIDAFVERARRAYDDCEFHILFHELLELCNEHLSAVYLDVLKDRMYCEAPDDPRRVASQVVMYRALTTIVRAAAPVLSFTCDEIWPLLPADPARPASVFLADFPQVDAVDAWDEGFDLVELLLTVRRRVSEEIERLRPRRKGEREPGQIGSSQEAVVRVRVTPDRAEELQANVELLREICIVASLTVEASPRPHESGVHVTMGFDEVAERLQAVSLRHESGMDVEVTRSEEPRCPRCWNHRSSIGLSARFPELCGRCVSVVERFHVPPAPGGATA